MKKVSLFCAAALSCCCTILFAQPSAIPPDFFGINGWMNEKVGDATNNYNCNGLSQAELNNPQPCYLYGKVDDNSEMAAVTCTTKIKSLHVKLIRYGGTAVDMNMPTYEQYVNEIDYIRSLGAEPIIQIPYHDGGLYSCTGL